MQQSLHHRFHLSVHPNLRAVLFDMDGVLVQTEQLKAEAHAATINTLGGTVPPQFYQLHMGKSFDAVQGAFLHEANLVDHSGKYTQIFEDIYSMFLKDRMHVTPGIPQLLAVLSDLHIRLAVVTSSKRWMAKSILSQAQIDTFFQCWVTAEDVITHKPNPEMYNLALTRLQVDHRSAVAIEDSAAGVDSAASAGIQVVFFQHYFNSLHDRSRASAQLSSFDDVGGVVNAIEEALGASLER